MKTITIQAVNKPSSYNEWITYIRNNAPKLPNIIIEWKTIEQYEAEIKAQDYKKMY